MRRLSGPAPALLLSRPPTLPHAAELASHATFRGFQFTTRNGFGELGPFIEKINVMAWLEEMVLRLGPSAVMYAQQFPDADQKLTRFLLEFGADLIEAYKKAS
jgi:hypothetical protein